ncbi:ribonuclease E/G, partial [Citrobacter freundii]|nr:ribonuclease E/G [Citrobacter freundii]
EDKKPVTRDAELPSNKPSQEAEPAPVLPLTPQKEQTPRVANDPRERRRLAKLAAEQAFEQVKQQHSAPEEATPVAPAVEETVVAPAAETQAPVESKQQPLELDQVSEVAQSETSEKTPAETVVEAPVVKQPKASARAKAAAEQAVAPTETTAEVESEDSKADLDKPNRPPRRPRGRPPKKANPVAE